MNTKLHKCQCIPIDKNLNKVLEAFLAFNNLVNRMETILLDVLLILFRVLFSFQLKENQLTIKVKVVLVNSHKK